MIYLRERGADTVGEFAGEDIHDPRTGKSVPGIVMHRDDAGELYEIEIYSGASKRLDLKTSSFAAYPRTTLWMRARLAVRRPRPRAGPWAAFFAYG